MHHSWAVLDGLTSSLPSFPQLINFMLGDMSLRALAHRLAFCAYSRAESWPICQSPATILVVRLALLPSLGKGTYPTFRLRNDHVSFCNISTPGTVLLTAQTDIFDIIGLFMTVLPSHIGVVSISRAIHIFEPIHCFFHLLRRFSMHRPY